MATSIPHYTYTGEHESKLENGYWYIILKSSGTLNFNFDISQCEVALVGGGGGGGYGTPSSVREVDYTNFGTDAKCGGGGGGGGAVLSASYINLSAGADYEIVIGTGGMTNMYSNVGGSGGSTTAFGYTAIGGKGGRAGRYVTVYTRPIAGMTINLAGGDPGNANGGKGGDGGYTSYPYSTFTPTAATAGANGTYIFDRYLGGGGGGGDTNVPDASNGIKSGGLGGGGTTATAGEANTGGGGGGGRANYVNGTIFSYASDGGTGGTGLVMIRCLNNERLPVTYNSIKPSEIYYNGTKITSLIYNGTTIF